MAKKHILASGGTANYAVVSEPSAPLAVQYAARELVHYLERITSAAWRVTSPGYLDGALPIIVGFCGLSAMFEVPIDKTLGPEEYIIRSSDGGIVIAGGGPRGTLYGVYDFLERLGCRFLAPDETVVPGISELSCEPFDVRESPAFEYRYGYYRPSLNPDYSARVRMNGAAAGELHGGYLKYHRGAHHSFASLVPPEKYFDEHPEYFSLSGGVRVKNRQLCLTNPDVYRIMLEELRRRLRENPAENIHSVSINDCEGYCECPACSAADEEQESHAGSLVQLLNRLAEDLEKEFPDVIIGTLSYLHTRKPPKNLAPRHNVIIWLCSIECCFTHPLNECVDVYGPRMGKQSFPGDLQGWTELTKNVFIWDYVNNFAHYMQPHPNLQVLQPNLRYYRDCGVRGVFEQGHTNCENGTPCLNELRYYLIAKLLWNPDCDVEAHKRDFLDGYYGNAAPAVAKFIDVFEEKVQKDNIHMGISSPPDSEYLDEGTLKKAEKALDEADKLADGDAKICARLARLRILILYPRLAVRVRDGEATREEINGFFNEVYRLGYSRVEEAMDNEARRRYTLEMGRLNNLIKGHFRDRALQKNIT